LGDVLDDLGFVLFGKSLFKILVRVLNGFKKLFLFEVLRSIEDTFLLLLRLFLFSESLEESLVHDNIKEVEDLLDIILRDLVRNMLNFLFFFREFAIMCCE
jgi:hypothetical protein